MLKKKKTRKSAATARGQKNSLRSAGARQTTRTRREDEDNMRDVRGGRHESERDTQGRFVSDDRSYGQHRDDRGGRYDYQDDMRRPQGRARGGRYEEEDRAHYRSRTRDEDHYRDYDRDSYRPARYSREEEDERYYPAPGRARNEDYGGWMRDAGRAEPARRGHARR